MTARDATRYIQSIARNDPPLNITEVADDAALAAEQKSLRGYVPTPEQIAAECLKIRAEKGETAEIQAAISDLVSDEFEEWDE